MNNKEGITKLLNKIINCRFIIAIIAFVLILGLKLHGSSIGMWDTYVSEKIDNSEISILLGENRAIRSDEWSVQAPYYFAQAESESFYPLYNDNIISGGLNMILAYNAPVADITILAKPFNWGFLLLGKEYGLSWYWGFKIIGLLLLAFEVAMILTKKNKILSFVSAFWIAFSPAVQWWFMQHVGDVVFYTLAIITAFYKYFEYRENLKVKIAFAVMLALSAVGFILVLYPAFQVPMAYIILIMISVIYFSYFKRPKLAKSDYIIIPATMMIIAAMTIHFAINSMDAIKAVFGTVYPGKRICTGGDGEIARLCEYMLNVFIPFKDINNLNNCEVSSFINFFIGSVVVVIVAVKKSIKERTMGIALLLAAILQLAWCFVGTPQWLAKLTLLSFVPTFRMITVFNFTAMLLSIWALGIVFDSEIISKRKGIVISIVTVVVYGMLIYKSKYIGYVSGKYYMMLLLLFLVLNLTAFCRYKKLFCITMMAVIILSGATVNPVARGVGAIYNKTLAQTIQNIERDDPEAIWLAEGLDTRGEFIYANGAKTINGTHFYPDKALWSKLEKDADYGNIYNRYAHVHIQLVDNETDFILNYPDDFTIKMNIDELAALGIDYIWTKKELDKLCIGGKVKFKELYYSSLDGNRVYKVEY